MTSPGNKPAPAQTGISARNVLPARIRTMRDDGTTSRLDLELQGGESLVATLARASVVELGLRESDEVLAMVKAPWLMLLAGSGPVALSTPNQLAGTITGLVPGAVNSELRLRTHGGNELVAVLPRDAVAECGLAVGAPATAIVNPADVVVGTVPLRK